MKTTTPNEDLVRGIWRENPVLIQLLGLCPALAVTNTVANSLAMGLATFFVLCILIIATFVTVADMTLEAVVPEIHKALGAFIALIVVNCMILGRQEAFASKRPVGRALLDAVGTGFGFLIALTLMGAFREVLGNGSFLGVSLFGPSFEPWVVMILPPGGFLALGTIILLLSWVQGRKKVTGLPGELDDDREGDLAARRAA